MPPALDPFEQHVRRFLAGRERILAGGPALIGVSGGPDSVALLAACAAVRSRIDLRPHAVHVDHGLRGGESRADAAYVRRLTGRLGVPVTVVTAEVGRYRSRPRRASLEAAARHARYGAFADAARETDASVLLVAHTADDQAETVLMNLMRGAGLRGVSGMTPDAPFPPVPGEPCPPPVRLLRPLLDVRRTEVVRYLRSRRLRPRSDPSNADPRHLRNRIRNELAPLMERLRPGSTGGLLRAASAAAEAEEALALLADRLWQDTAEVLDGHGARASVRLSAGALLEPAVSKLARTLTYARALETAGGTREGFGSRHLSAVEGLLHAGTGSLDLPRGVRVSRSRSALTFVAGSGTASSGSG